MNSARSSFALGGRLLFGGMGGEISFCPEQRPVRDQGQRNAKVRNQDDLRTTILGSNNNVFGAKRVSLSIKAIIRSTAFWLTSSEA